MLPATNVLARWEDWALAQADRIDPVKTRGFFTWMRTTAASEEARLPQNFLAADLAAGLALRTSVEIPIATVVNVAAY